MSDTTNEELEPVTKLVTPVHVEYTYTPGVAMERFLRGVRKGKIIGAACDACGRVYVPPRGACARCAAPTSEEREVAHKGTIVTFSVVRVPSENIDVPLPYCGANILLDGADISLTALIQECNFEDVHIGMRVEAVWLPESEWDYSMSNIKYFRPIDEPDVPFAEIKEYS
jgi:uncharacterized OB-fold protein